jgi:DNA helicase-2/ATP-dependent DNA helicase PcrA
MTHAHWDEITQITGRKVAPDTFNDGVGGDQLIAFHLHLAKNMGRTYAEHFHRVAGSLISRRLNFGSMSKGGGLSEFVRLGELIEQYKANYGLMDFSDMLAQGCNCAPIDVDYAIIDEAQDLSPLQWRFCQKIFGNCKKVWVAGDDDQAIYSWAGADLYTFRHMDASRRVLDHSWRLPQTIWEMANGIVETIEDRYQKVWEPRDDVGEFKFVSHLSDCPLDNDESWYLLTRTKSQQQGLVHWLRGHGYTYLRNGVHSVKSNHLDLAKAWTKLLRGGGATPNQVRALYDNMRLDQWEKNPYPTLDRAEIDDRFRMGDLVEMFGLNVTEGIWHDVLTIDRVDTNYYRAVKDRFGNDALTEEPKILISTIHGVKGGEADNVFFSNSMGQRPYRNYRHGHTRDDEARIFYVAATRAKKRLFIRPSLQCAFPLPIGGKK